MEKYENENYKKGEIINQSRHQFIYGYDGEKRTSFLKDLEKENKIKTDLNTSMAIYIEDYGLPVIDYDKRKRDSGLIKIVSAEYFNFSVLSEIIENYLENSSGEKDENVNKMIKRFYNIDIKKTEEILSLFKDSKEFYKNYYEDYLKNGETSYKVDDLKIPFIDLYSYLDQLKKAINNDSYFALLIDNKKDVSLSSIKTINFYIGGRINDTISMKIATEPDKWKTYLTSNDEYVQSVHDYGDVELDSSLKKVLKKSWRL